MAKVEDGRTGGSVVMGEGWEIADEGAKTMIRERGRKRVLSIWEKSLWKEMMIIMAENEGSGRVEVIDNQKLTLKYDLDAEMEGGRDGP